MKHIRKSRGYTQEEFAKLLGVTQSYVAKLESGDRIIENLTFGKIIKMSEILGICPIALMCRLMNDLTKCSLIDRDIKYEECYLIKKYHRFLREE